MSQTDAERVSRRGADAWDKHDSKEFLALLARDITWTDPILPQPIRSRSEAKRHFRMWLRAFSDMQVELSTIHADEVNVDGQIHFHGTNDGRIDLGGVHHGPTGEHVAEVTPCRIQVKDGLIVELETDSRFLFELMRRYDALDAPEVTSESAPEGSSGLSGESRQETLHSPNGPGTQGPTGTEVRLLNRRSWWHEFVDTLSRRTPEYRAAGVGLWGRARMSAWFESRRHQGN